jgi:hypothetical protein
VELDDLVEIIWRATQAAGIDAKLSKEYGLTSIQFKMAPDETLCLYWGKVVVNGPECLVLTYGKWKLKNGQLDRAIKHYRRSYEVEDPESLVKLSVDLRAHGIDCMFGE